MARRRDPKIGDSVYVRFRVAAGPNKDGKYVLHIERPNGTGTTVPEQLATLPAAPGIGYPILVPPDWICGDRR